MENIKVLKITHPLYPQLLKKIKDPPLNLYFCGNPAFKNCFAVVGTRRCSPYGKELVLKIVPQLVSAGLTIVSGLAPGIDTWVHKTVLEAKGKTIAVLGTGLKKKTIYPQKNISLAQKIIEKGGCLLSEYPPLAHGNRFSFVKRNRIISGLSLGVLVVEAPERSGALITARYAFSQKRKVFALPGSLFSPASKGCHFLIKKGAHLTEDAGDILKVLKLKNKIKKEKHKNNNLCQEKEQKLILECLKQGALELDQIIRTSGLSPEKVISTIANLEIKGKVKNLGGNIFAKT